MSLALAGGFFTTEPPGKPSADSFKLPRVKSSQVSVGKAGLKLESRGVINSPLYLCMNWSCRGVSAAQCLEVNHSGRTWPAQPLPSPQATAS